MSIALKSLSLGLNASPMISLTTPLRTMSVQNRAHTGEEARTGRRRQVFRWPHVIGADARTLAVTVNNWYLATTGQVSMPNDIAIVELSIEAPNGTALPVNFSGVRGKALVAGDTNILSDEIAAGMFGYSTITRGHVYWIKGIVEVATAGLRIPYASTQRVDAAGSQVRWYDPAVTTPSSTDVSGVYTFTGTAPEAERNQGFYPMLVGRPVTDGPSFIALGDSIGDYRDDDGTNGMYGRAMFHRAMTKLDNADAFGLINFCKAGSGTSAFTGGAKIIPYLSYARNVFVEYGTNNLGITGSVAASSVTSQLAIIYSTLRSNGTSKIIATKLMPYTDTTDNWATAANQTPKPGWGAGEAASQVNDWIDTQIGTAIDHVVPMDTLRDAGNSVKWLSNGTANYTTTDGLHPTKAGHLLARAEIRTLIEGL